MKRPLLTLTLGLCAFAFAPQARGELIELADGRVLHGKILSGETSEDGLAVQVFDTGGTVVVGWDHILETRRKKLRILYGIDAPEEEGIPLTGHSVKLTNGVNVRGVVLNARALDEPLRLKTPTGEKTYPRATVAKVDELKIDALEAYTPSELYDMKMAEGAPETSKEHFEMGDYCMRLGDYEHAAQHFETAKADAEFGSTPAGKSLDSRLRRAEVMIRARGAQELVLKMKQAMYLKKWNDALSMLDDLDDGYKDEAIRNAINFDRLENQVVKGRDKHYRKQVQVSVYKLADRMIQKKVRETKPRRMDPDAPMERAAKGTLAGARQWAARDLPGELWEKVGADHGLEAEEVDRFWKERSSRRVRTATYGTGSFIVLKKANLPKPKNRRRPPGARRGDNKRGASAQQVEKPKTDEEWWDSVGASDKSKWLMADFVEGSSLFEIIRADESALCSSCAGRGFTTTTSTDGGESNHFCPQCNGAGKSRRVLYR